MRADHAVRHNAAVGALVGLAVGDVLSHADSAPPTVCAGSIEHPPWSGTTSRSFSTAEQYLNREPLDMGSSATDVVACAVALADPDASPPLLGDPDAVLVCSLVRDGLLGKLDLDTSAASDPITAAAINAVHDATGFVDTMSRLHAPRRALPLAGALAGLRWGLAGIPSTWATGVHGPVGTRTYGLRQVRRLAERLMQQDAPVPPEPRRSLGPREVAPKLWLSNLHAVPRFLAEHPDGAVISLCPTTGAFDNHLVRREFAIHDAGGSKVNPLLALVVDEILATIDAFHGEGRHVLVHCHHGASRTGLVLRAWLVQNLDLDVDDATTEAQVRWPKTSTWNNAFSAEIKRRSADRPGTG